MSPGSPPFPQGLGGLGEPGEPAQPAGPASRVDLNLRDRVVTVRFELHWSDEVYGRVVVPRLFGLANQVKGKAAVR